MTQQPLFTPDRGDWTPGKASDECYTPPWLLDLAEQALGGPIDTDPAWSPLSAVRPRAQGWTHVDGGQDRPWLGRVFCNPPYSDPGAFIRRARDHDGPAVLLVKLDPSTRWFAEALDGGAVLVLLRNRVRFVGEYADGNAAPFPSAVLAFRCPDVQAFAGVAWIR